MQTITSQDELAELVRSQPRIRVRGGGTKLATSAMANTSVAKLAGILQYNPSEFTITALAGTRIAEIEQLLHRKNQYLPFDPPLVSAGSTLGGTVAAGLSGSGRFRYGGVRDFLLGARIITGDGQQVTIGSKVVKNSAGFDLPKLMVGSLGCFGILTELTFKVFPQPQKFSSVVFETESCEQAVEILKRFSQSKLDLSSLDLDEQLRVWVRIGGLSESVSSRIQRVLRHVEMAGAVVPDQEESNYWEENREFSWIPANFNLVKVALTPDKVVPLRAKCAETRMRFSVGGHLAWIAWPASEDVRLLDSILSELQCSGVLITGECESLFVGIWQEDEFTSRLRTVLDPHRKFALPLS